MSYDTPDVYYQPEKFGLEKVSEVDYSSGSYEFDIRCVWKHADGRLFTARDSGCSCPSPFEDFTSLEKCSPFSLEEIENEVKKEREDNTYSGGDVTTFLEKIRSL